MGNIAKTHGFGKSNLSQTLGMLQLRNRPTLFVVSKGKKAKPGITAAPTRRDLIVSYVYWTCRYMPGGRGRFFTSGGVLKARAVGDAMGIHPSNIGRVFAGKQRAEEDFLKGLMKLGGFEERHDFEKRLADFRPIPAAAVRNYP